MKIFLFILIVCLYSCSYRKTDSTPKSSAIHAEPVQSSEDSIPKMKCDSIFLLTEKQFDSIVTNGLELLTHKKLSEITDAQHRNIIRAYNRIWISELEISKYATGDYAKLKNFLSDPAYIQGMVKVYPDWSPNRGMGMYFHKLNVELRGTPCRWSIFSLKK